MKCEVYRKLFSDFMDNEFLEERTEDFKDHLRICRACRKELEKFRHAQTLLKLLPKKEAPAELWEAIAAEMEPAEPRLVFLLQSVRASERFKHRTRSFAPVRIYGMSFGNLRRE